MNRETKDFLRFVRDAENPSPEDEQRVLRSLHTAISLGAVSGAAISLASKTANGASSQSGAATTIAKTSSGWSAIIGSQWGVLAVCTAASLTAGHASSRSSVEPMVSPPEVALPAPGQEAPPPPSVHLPVVPDETVPPEHPAKEEALDKPEEKPRVTLRRRENVASRHSTPMPSPEAPKNDLPALGSASPLTKEPPVPSSLERELHLLRRVQIALRNGNGAEALRQLDAHGLGDPRLAAERGAARILALCVVGRVNDARRAASAFLRRYPSSVHRRAIESSCANSTRIVEP